MQEPAETALGHGLIFLLKHAPSRLRERPWHGTFAPRIIDDRCSGHGPRSRGVVPLHPPQRPSLALSPTHDKPRPLWLICWASRSNRKPLTQSKPFQSSFWLAVVS
jgi:hypothetical protein